MTYIRVYCTKQKLTLKPTYVHLDICITNECVGMRTRIVFILIKYRNNMHATCSLNAIVSCVLINPVETCVLINHVVKGVLINHVVKGVLINPVVTGVLINPVVTGVLINPVVIGVLIKSPINMSAY